MKTRMQMTEAWEPTYPGQIEKHFPLVPGLGCVLAVPPETGVAEGRSCSQ